MKKMTYEQTLEQLKQTVERLESGSATLDESVSLYEQGMALAAQCAKYLESAKQKITDISALRAEAATDE